MSGHSKWKNIAHRKEKTDAQRAKLFTKLSREIIVAVKSGGPDPVSNMRLSAVITKARAGNVPMDNILRVIARAGGGGENTDYEDVQYEGYGPGGVALIVEAMTDNRNRTAGEVRHAFDKFNGNMGATGCVGWMFDEKGVIIIPSEGLDDEVMMLEAIEAGALDFISNGDVYELTTAPEECAKVSEALEKAGYTLLSAQVERVPQTWVALVDELEIRNMRRMLDMLEDNDDVQSVWHNWENEDE